MASTYAGISFGNAGCAAVHATSYPLGATYHVPHGEANYAMFTGVFKEYYRLNPNGKLKKLNHMISEMIECEEVEVYEKLEELLNHIIEKKALHEYNENYDISPAFGLYVIEDKAMSMDKISNAVPASRPLRRTSLEMESGFSSTLL